MSEEFIGGLVLGSGFTIIGIFILKLISLEIKSYIHKVVFEEKMRRE
jgi:hypothetical protein